MTETDIIIKDGTGQLKTRKAAGDGIKLPFIPANSIDGYIPDTETGDLAASRASLKKLDGDNGSFIGDVTDEYITIMDWACKGYNNYFVVLKNTHETHGLYYKVTGYLCIGGLEIPLISETLLDGDGQTDLLPILDGPWACIIVEVKNVTPGGSDDASYEIDYAGSI